MIKHTRHSWKKKLRNEIITKRYKDGRIVECKIYNAKECIHCKLRKGEIRSGRSTWINYHTLIYYKDKVILSEDGRLPYQCIDEMFFSEGEFLI